MTATFVQAGPYEIPDSLASTRARSCEATDKATRSIMQTQLPLEFRPPHHAVPFCSPGCQKFI
ncbi:MAG: hypothetical protein DMF95_27345 [Acidobacteria bacterium]|nr:MAG: hypothetical protein DMF95_27345 [Acidobacteriota bacterium]